MENILKDVQKKNKQGSKGNDPPGKRSRSRNEGAAAAASNSLLDILQILSREAKINNDASKQRVLAELRNTSEEAQQQIMMLTEQFGHKGSLQILTKFAIFFEKHTGNRFNLDELTKLYVRTLKLESSKEEIEKKKRIKLEKQRLLEENELLIQNASKIFKINKNDQKKIQAGAQNNPILRTILQNYLPTSDIMNVFLEKYADDDKKPLLLRLKEFLTPEIRAEISKSVGFIKEKNLFTGLPGLKLGGSDEEGEIERILDEEDEIEEEEDEDEIERLLEEEGDEEVAEIRRDARARLALEIEEEKEEEEEEEGQKMQAAMEEDEEEDGQKKVEDDFQLYDIFGIDRTGYLQYAQGMAARKILEQKGNKDLANKYYTKCNALDLKVLPEPFDRIAYKYFVNGSALLLKGSYLGALEQFHNCLTTVRKAMPKQNVTVAEEMQSVINQANIPFAMEVDAVLTEIQIAKNVAQERMAELITLRLNRWEINKQEANEEMARVLVSETQISYAESIVRASPWAYTRITFSDKTKRLMDKFKVKNIWILPLNDTTFRDLVGLNRETKTIDGDTYYKPINLFFNVYLNETTEEGDVITFGEYKMKVAYDVGDEIVKHDKNIDYDQKQLFVERIVTGPKAVKNIWILAINEDAKELVNCGKSRFFGPEKYCIQGKHFYNKFLRSSVVSPNNVVTIAGKFKVKIKYELANGSIVDHDALINEEKQVTIAQIFASDSAKIESLKNIPVNLITFSPVLFEKINYILADYIDDEALRKELISQCIAKAATDNGTMNTLFQLLSKVIAYLHFDYLTYEETELKATNFKRKVESNFYPSVLELLLLSPEQKVNSSDEKLLNYYKNREAYIVDTLLLKLQNVLFQGGKFMALKHELLTPENDILYITNVYKGILVERKPVPKQSAEKTQEQLKNEKEQREHAESVFNVLYHIQKSINEYKS
uniref:Uncharacterized protein n=1 Tax=viral metagenome TaxID=1070528 RepID=A0A6C0KQI2_9ZZZZ